ncbi:hypothetical protein ANACAC_01013 [Anaerostipes caccae L1-92]|uniref:Uncharacterized protein n=1 Tax=Anaerostipes caccae (strain DSM 14662 / CCUG 47493 / JCM 13470 / NCIMB 13811 / L1-92) TaxID=411490 RepID=B0MBJ2_ANACD|nr:hypothetical protein ANACAC_01013 [Anaerostipes caccae L1-92]
MYSPRSVFYFTGKVAELSCEIKKSPKSCNTGLQGFNKLKFTHK